jgi:hypothetical protein
VYVRPDALPLSIWVRELVWSNDTTFVKKLRDGRLQWRLGASGPDDYCAPSVNVPDALGG